MIGGGGVEFVLLFLVGLLSGTLGSLAGLGGGVVTVPALLFMSTAGFLQIDISPQMAVGTSLVVIIFTALSSTLSYIKAKKVHYRTGFLLFAGSGPGSIAGARLNEALNIDQFYLYFGLFVIGMALFMLMKSRLNPVRHDDEHNSTAFQPVKAILVSFAVGLLSGLFGIGGGALLVPAMLLLFHYPIHVAVPTSMFVIFFSALTGSATHIALGHVSWEILLSLVPGAWFGGKLGAYWNQNISGVTLETVFRIFLFLIGLRLISLGLT